MHEPFGMALFALRRGTSALLRRLERAHGQPDDWAHHFFFATRMRLCSDQVKREQ